MFLLELTRSRVFELVHNGFLKLNLKRVEQLKKKTVTPYLFN